MHSMFVYYIIKIKHNIKIQGDKYEHTYIKSPAGIFTEAEYLMMISTRS